MKPIIFSTEMVKAILDGRKTQMRKVIKPQPDEIGIIKCVTNMGKDSFLDVVNDKGLSEYRLGGILWVRETFFEYKSAYYYKSDNRHVELEKLGITFKWKPSIHMPRAAARIFLRVLGVRVERVQDISEADAKLEGVALMTTPNITGTGRSYTQGFGELWNSINAKRGFGWDANPWVWVYDFERCDENGN
jgi:hypothetical protein